MSNAENIRVLYDRRKIQYSELDVSDLGRPRISWHWFRQGALRSGTRHFGSNLIFLASLFTHVVLRTIVSF